MKRRRDSAAPALASRPEAAGAPPAAAPGRKKRRHAAPAAPAAEAAPAAPAPPAADAGEAGPAADRSFDAAGQEIDDAGAPAHRKAAKLQRGLQHPKLEVTPPPTGATQAALRRLSRRKPIEQRVTPPVLSRFERAVLLGFRARELSLGAPTAAPLTSPRLGHWNPVETAALELELGLLDAYAVRRPLFGSGGEVEEWLVGDFDQL
eukprot:TRINITY_DN12633_c0_g1_i1.p1 TRINITY_DN12633_c0_g1~~TRINITY_DN12633_c0_g1_i1.p1  ORF type:complete len:242 (+),score=71.62 TRINITY_DN12633_c0_g1_i1:111-728(+)